MAARSNGIQRCGHSYGAGLRYLASLFHLFWGAHAPSRLRDDEAAPAAQARVPVGASPTGLASANLKGCCMNKVQVCGEAPQAARETRALPESLCGLITGRVAVALAFCLLAGCSRPASNRIQGYIEGEFIYVASPLAGTLHSLPVQKGTHVKLGDALFALESASEEIMRDEAERRLAQARSNLEDAKKGKRPSEIESIEAQLQQARAALALSDKDLARQDQLFRAGATAAQDLDRARAANDQNRQRVAQLDAERKTAQLGARSDQIASAEANVRALESALAKAEWDFSQKRRTAPQAGLVFDTLYHEGEWVAAGRPVVSLLPPQNIKVRAFVPEPQIASVHLGDSVLVIVDGVRESLKAKVSFISPKVEYTPPVIYSQESRRKLVFMIEAVFDPNAAANLHPGQPVDVQLGP